MEAYTATWRGPSGRELGPWLIAELTADGGEQMPDLRVSNLSSGHSCPVDLPQLTLHGRDVNSRQWVVSPIAKFLAKKQILLFEST